MLRQVNHPVNLRALRSAASDLRERYRDTFTKRGGDLRISAGKRRNLPSLRKAIQLNASVDWAKSRIYEHAEIEVARARPLSRRWTRTRSSADALLMVEEQLNGWLGGSE